MKFVPVGVFVVCSAAYTGYTDADCNLDCVVVVVMLVAGGGSDGGSGNLPVMSGAIYFTCTGGGIIYRYRHTT